MIEPFGSWTSAANLVDIHTFYIYIYIYIYLHTHIHTCLHTRNKNICVYIYIYICICIYIYFVYIYTIYIYIYIYIHIYTHACTRTLIKKKTGNVPHVHRYMCMLKNIHIIHILQYTCAHV